MRKTWWIVILLVGIIGCPSNPTLTAIKIYRVQYYENHDQHILEKWKNLAEKETKTNPTNCLGWFFLGEAYINLGEVLSKPDTMLKGAMLVKKGFDIDSLKVLKELSVNQEGYWSVFKNVTDRLIQRGEYNTAKEFLHIAIKILPTRAENYTMAGEIALEDGDTTKALTSYRKAIDLDPKNANAYADIGSIFSNRGTVDSSKHYFSKAKDLMSGNLIRLIEMIVPDRDVNETRDPVIKASIFLEDKKEAEAKKVLGEVGIGDLEPKKRLLNNLTTLRYEMGSLLFKIGLDYFKAKDSDNAIQTFKEVLELVPKHTGARFNAGLIEYQLKRYKDAETEFRTLSATKPDDYRTWFYLGAAIAQQKRYRDAIEPFEKAMEINPKNPDIYRNLALIYSKVGEKKKAVEYYKKAQELEKGVK